MIHVDAGIDQRAHRFNVAALGCRNQRRATVAIGACEIGAVCECHAQDVEMPARTGVEVGAVLDRILRIHVGAGIDQRAGHFDVIAVGGDQQRRCARAVARIDVRAIPQAVVERFDVAIRRGLQ